MNCIDILALVARVLLGKKNLAILRIKKQPFFR